MDILNEDMYSKEVRDFIRLSKKTEKFDVEKRVAKIHENFQSFLNEDIYSQEMRNFIRFSGKTEKFDDLRKRLRLLYDYIDTEGWLALGCGAFRCTFQTPKGELVKIARPDNFYKGISMNEEEVNKFNRQDLKAFPRVEETDKEYLWFVVEKVNVLEYGHDRDIIDKLFPKLMNIYDFAFSDNGPPPFRLVGTLMDYVYRDALEGYEKDYKELMKKMNFELHLYNANLSNKEKKIFFESIFDYVSNGDLNWKILKTAIINADVDSFDLREENIGYTDDGVIKIIDAG